MFAPLIVLSSVDLCNLNKKHILVKQTCRKTLPDNVYPYKSMQQRSVRESVLERFSIFASAR